MSERERNYSDIAQFHNQKDPNFNTENGVIFSGGQEYEKYALYLTEIERADTTPEKSSLEKHLGGVINLIDNLSLDKNSKDDPAQFDILNKKREQAKKLISQVLVKVGEYIATRQKTELAKNHGDLEDPQKYKDELEGSDRTQRVAHNALIDSINMTNRFLNLNFGVTDDEVIKNWQNQEKLSGRPVAQVERVAWPKNIICPDEINLKDRNSIAQWAQELYKNVALNKKWNL